MFDSGPRPLQPGCDVLLEVTLYLWQLPDGKQVISSKRTNSRGVSTTRQWDVTPGHSVTGAVADIMGYVGKTLQDEFSTRGAV